MGDIEFFDFYVIIGFVGMWNCIMFSFIIIVIVFCNFLWFFGLNCDLDVVKILFKFYLYVFVGEVLGGLLVNSDREYFIYFFGNIIVVEEIKEDKKLVFGGRGLGIKGGIKSRIILEDLKMC